MTTLLALDWSELCYCPSCRVMGGIAGKNL
jgi:hypothetical protein